MLYTTVTKAIFRHQNVVSRGSSGHDGNARKPSKFKESSLLIQDLSDYYFKVLKSNATFKRFWIFRSCLPAPLPKI